MNVTDMRPLTGRTAVVTGAASGMGAATARLLAARGARVALLARRGERLVDLVGEIEKDGGAALAVPTDVTSTESVAEAAVSIRDHLGPVDLLVNAAGTMLPNPIEAGRADEWTRMIDTNVTGVLRLIKEFTPDLLTAAAAGRTADLVNISSIGAHVAFPSYAVYGATKAALTQLSANLRTELGPRDVRVTNIEPGLTDTELGQGIDNAELADQLDQMRGLIGPLAAEDIADVVAFAVAQPRRVNLRQIVVLPTRQA